MLAHQPRIGASQVRDAPPGDADEGAERGSLGAEAALFVSVLARSALFVTILASWRVG